MSIETREKPKGMQSTSVGSSGGGDDGGDRGGGGLSRSGLSRIRSAPATWLEALLEEDEEESLKPNLGLTDLLTGNSNDLPTTSRGSFEFPIAVEQGLYQQGGFHRQNSTPADFLSGASDGFIQSFGIPANYDYLSENIDVSPGSKRSREMEALFSSPEFTSQMVKDLFL